MGVPKSCSGMSPPEIRRELERLGVTLSGFASQWGNLLDSVYKEQWEMERRQALIKAGSDFKREEALRREREERERQLRDAREEKHLLATNTHIASWVEMVRATGRSRGCAVLTRRGATRRARTGRRRARRCSWTRCRAGCCCASCARCRRSRRSTSAGAT